MREIRCPRCRRPLESSGEVTDPTGVVMPDYLCEHCTVPWEFDGMRVETCLTFALTPDGDMLDPETLERLE